MRKYEYVKVSMKTGFLSTKTPPYHKIIDEYAAKGYRYVGWFPSRTSNLLSGVLEELELVFDYEY